MAEPRTFTLKYLRELAKKHLIPGYTKLKTKSDLLLALKKFAPAIFTDEDTAPPSPAKPSRASGPVMERSTPSVPPARVIRFQSPARASVSPVAASVSPRPEPTPVVAEPIVEGFFVARIAGEKEAYRHHLTEDRAAPVRQVQMGPVYDEKLRTLPASYEDDALVLLPKDPHTLFVLWDFHPETRRRCAEGLENPKTIMRLYERGALIRDVDFALESHSFYLHGVAAGRRYHVEIHFIDVNGTSRRLGKASNSIELPPDGISSDTSVRFMRIAWDFPLGLIKELKAQQEVAFELPPEERRYTVWKRTALPGSQSALESSEAHVERTPGAKYVASDRRMPQGTGHAQGSSDHLLGGSSDIQQSRREKR